MGKWEETQEAYCSREGPEEKVIPETGKRPCIMPECPYCPACKYGLVDWHNNDPAFPEWICLYDPAEDEKN